MTAPAIRAGQVWTPREGARTEARKVHWIGPSPDWEPIVEWDSELAWGGTISTECSAASFRAWIRRHGATVSEPEGGV